MPVWLVALLVPLCMACAEPRPRAPLAVEAPVEEPSCVERCLAARQKEAVGWAMIQAQCAERCASPRPLPALGAESSTAAPLR